MLVEINCDNCGSVFDRARNEVNRSKRKGLKSFCSKECFGIHNSFSKIIIHEPNVSCAICDKEFYLTPSKKAISKSGLHFCCREHKDIAQRLDGLKELHLPHYNNGSATKYRKLAFSNYPHLCDECGWCKIIDILLVHHIDFNRSNNYLLNLRILCPICHDTIHYENKNGRFTTKYSGDR